SPARVIFASEDGTLSAFRGVPIVTVVPNNGSGAVYKGLAIDSTTAGTLLYATNFHAGTVDVFNSTFTPVQVPGGFVDPDLPAGYAPFGIQNLGGIIYVTYPLQDTDKHDDVPGQGHDFVNDFDTAGHLLQLAADMLNHMTSKEKLNSQWRLVPAPANFRTLRNPLFRRNFGDGRIQACDPPKVTGSGEFQSRGPLPSANWPPLEIDGLWALS